MFKEKILLLSSGYKIMTVDNVGKGLFHWLTDIFSTSDPLCPLSTDFPALLTSTLTKETAHYSESLLIICLSVHGVTSEKTVILLSYLAELPFIALTDKSTNFCVIVYK